MKNTRLNYYKHIKKIILDYYIYMKNTRLNYYKYMKNTRLNYYKHIKKIILDYYKYMKNTILNIYKYMKNSSLNTYRYMKNTSLNTYRHIKKTSLNTYRHIKKTSLNIYKYIKKTSLNTYRHFLKYLKSYMVKLNDKYTAIYGHYIMHRNDYYNYFIILKLISKIIIITYYFMWDNLSTVVDAEFTRHVNNADLNHLGSGWNDRPSNQWGPISAHTWGDPALTRPEGPINEPIHIRVTRTINGWVSHYSFATLELLGDPHGQYSTRAIRIVDPHNQGGGFYNINNSISRQPFARNFANAIETAQTGGGFNRLRSLPLTSANERYLKALMDQYDIQFTPRDNNASVLVNTLRNLR